MSDEFLMSLEGDEWITSQPDFDLHQSKVMNPNPIVSVVIPNWNNGVYLRRAMDSIVNQTLGIENIEVLFTDDKSTDDSMEIMKEYVNQYPNFSVFELKQNTGAAAVPRNVGLARANGKYLAFLDPDDWYLETAMETLVSRLDASGDDFGIGGIIEVTDSRLKKVFAAISYQEVQNYPIEKLPAKFYSWMGPQGILVRHSLVKEHNLHFPIMRTSDDQKFFFEAMALAGTITQTTETINWLNHDSNNVGLMKLAGKSAEIFDNAKRLWYYLVEKQYNQEATRRLIARKLEIQFNRFFYTPAMRMVLTDDEFNDVIDQFKAIETDFGYDPSNYFDVEDKKVAWRIMMNHDLQKGFDYISWARTPEGAKVRKIVDGTVYAVPPMSDIQPTAFRFRAYGQQLKLDDNKLQITANIFTTANQVNELVIRRLADPDETYVVPLVNVNGSEYTFEMSAENFAALPGAKYQVLIRWDGFNYSNVVYDNFEYTAANDYGFYKRGNVLGLRTRPVPEAYSLSENDDEYTLTIRVSGWWNTLDGVMFINRKDENDKRFFKAVNNKDYRNYSTVEVQIPKTELSAFKAVKYSMQLIWNENQTGFISFGSLAEQDVTTSGFYETDKGNLALNNSAVIYLNQFSQNAEFVELGITSSNNRVVIEKLAFTNRKTMDLNLQADAKAEDDIHIVVLSNAEVDGIAGNHKIEAIASDGTRFAVAVPDKVNNLTGRYYITNKGNLGLK